MGLQLENYFISYYGLYIAGGIAVAALVGWCQIKRYRKNFNDFITIAGCMGVGAILGAKLLYLIVSWPQIDLSRLTEPDYFKALMSGGFVFYGGLLGGLGGVLACQKIFKIAVWSYVEVAVVCAPIAHAFGRLGCSSVGCCYGRPYHGIGAVTYTHSPFAPNDVSLFPVQRLEAAADIIIAVVLWLYINHHSEKKKYSLCIYLAAYSALRFLLEFMRYDGLERGSIWALSTSQWLSIIIVISAAFWYFKEKRRLSYN